VIRATIARGPTDRIVICVRCRDCGWRVAVEPRQLFAALRHRCRKQLELDPREAA
jgi:hypothetical protein